MNWAECPPRSLAMIQRVFFLLLNLITVASLVFADGPRDNIPENVRRIPKLGIEVSAKNQQALEAKLSVLGTNIALLRDRDDQQTRELWPDVQVFYRAVSDALRFQEFFQPSEIQAALDLLDDGIARSEQLLAGQAPWLNATGLVVRGYLSRIDHSVQPYGLVIPKTYTHKSAQPYRMDIWFHGRGETLSEVNFLHQRQKHAGTFTPVDTLVLHPYGRYSNAFKFAGEVDVLEAIESVSQQYRIDKNRTSVRGFSMGGAACWQFAVHYADSWFVANPGAGFSETPRFLDFFQKETLNPTWYEQKLWRLYDCDLWAKNLLHCPTVAYSGENDIQRQAADVMEEALLTHGIELTHIIGPETGHAYHPEAQATVTQLLDSIAERGRQSMPREVSLTTYTLKYNRMHWVSVEGLGTHWERARVDARIENPTKVTLATDNVTALSLNMPAGWAPLSITHPTEIVVNNQIVGSVRAKSDQSWQAQLHQINGAWQLGAIPARELQKKHNLQGPIDDAFMDSFIFVRPTKKARHAALDAWSQAELKRAIEHWRRHFRGHARVKNDSEITANDIDNANLILWGDPSSNLILKKIAKALPIAWDHQAIRTPAQNFPADQHALIAVYPNPLNKDRYVVLNSSFTFREFAYLNNARQVPKLPDWAVIDLSTPPDALWPGKVVAADFFDEQWQVRIAAE